ncbi:MAG TPA: zinc-binding dehydrogenase [Acidimicrobiales bacterium]|nr:zinc-binding dehydrogenase [Acidimicrobiales bacterium]
MRALRLLGDKHLDVYEVPDPEPGPADVVVRLTRAAVCGTDIHLYRAPADIVPPVVPGHEPVGVVEHAGDAAPVALLGTRVLVAGVVGCGGCAMCRSGVNNACAQAVAMGLSRDGADATHVVVPWTNVVALPDELSCDAAAVLTCAGGTAYTVMRECGVTGEDQVAVLGLGPVGLSLVILATSMGATVVGSDPVAARRRQALDLGAAAVVDPSTGDAAELLQAATSGRGYDVVAECVGRAETQKLALAVVAMRGRVAMAGLGDEPVTVNWMRDVLARHARVVGISATPIAYFPALVERAARLRLPFERLVTHRFPLEQAVEAFAVMESGDCGKVVFDFACS